MILIDAPKKGLSHLVGSTIAELHEFVKSIEWQGKKPFYHNPRGKKRPHYDLSGTHIHQACVAGATMVDTRALVKFLKLQYEKQ